MPEVVESERGLDVRDLTHRVFKTIGPELFVFDVLEPVVHPVEFACGEGLLPSRKDDCILYGRVGEVHSDKRFQGRGQGFDAVHGDFSQLRRG